ncbi:NucA/NucB deoxyribonuclease domain-containing protein [Streptomyces sp. NPDC093108]|uniref:NucA/NucB deoxyribonuclease domain-containing protein n=1 Tax=Streptomyces sp. NPDC093108 TaxID=3366030 RepID=UPI003800B641
MNPRGGFISFLAVLVTALTLIAPQTALAHGSAEQALPVRAVFGGDISPGSPVLPIGSQLPASLLEKSSEALTPPAPRSLTHAREEATRVLSGQQPAGLKAAALVARPMVDPIDPFVTVTYCRQATDGSEVTVATALDRYNWCAMRPSVVYSINESGEVTGTTTFRWVTAGKAARTGGRTINFTTAAYDFVDSGIVLPPALVHLEIDYTTSGYSDTDGSNPACNTIGNSPFTVHDWRLAGAMAEFVVSSDKSDGYSGDFISRCGIQQVGRSDLNIPWLPLLDVNVRMDSSAYVGSSGGAIFTDPFPLMWYQISSPDHGEVAQHIRDAQTNPASTFPTKAGKQIPGAVSSRKPLHRAVDVVWDLESSQRVRDNRTNRTAACAALSPTGTPAGKDCDEYPFASVWEGAGVGDNNFSVRYVDSAQNNNAGNELGTWYQNQRILGREAFFVQIYS